MRSRAFLIAVLMSMPACKGAIMRDAQTYNAELSWFQDAMTETAALSREMVEANCTCENGEFTDGTCEDLADNIVTIEARANWHLNMARFNAQLIEERPPEKPPEIPPAESLCPHDGNTP